MPAGPSVEAFHDYFIKCIPRMGIGLRSIRYNARIFLLFETFIEGSGWYRVLPLVQPVMISWRI
ncbi:hypothetical protein ASZ90_018126 [hydrocarbon metagenome]|uniref:Uncharacterized protein n=1 Tax=hydrocarbon metagenome TaxID=938273 RepID=A0A0W8E731_9ZZZZ